MAASGACAGVGEALAEGVAKGLGSEERPAGEEPSAQLLRWRVLDCQCLQLEASLEMARRHVLAAAARAERLARLLTALLAWVPEGAGEESVGDGPRPGGGGARGFGEGGLSG
jgi:hypothetical protein